MALHILATHPRDEHHRHQAADGRHPDVRSLGIER
jgi:hypothetical protein